MCGITAILGIECNKLLLDSLFQLQNRGYDSAGISSIKDSNFIITKKASTENNSALELLDINNHKNSINGIAHTRWATHGPKNDINSHPHLSMCNKISLIHNGIIENYKELKKKLISEGYIFKSETDSEVIVNLISYFYKKGFSEKESIKKTINKLIGTWALVIQFINKPLKLYCTKLGSPLLIGYNSKFAMAVSEQAGFCNNFDEYIILNNYDICEIEKKNKIIIKTNNSYKKKECLEINNSLSPEPYKYWTIKEIYEQSECCLKAINYGGRILSESEVKLGGLEKHKSILKNIKNLIILGCGTSLHAGYIGSYFFKKISGFNTVQIFDGAEFSVIDIPKNGETAFLLLSQSGETKDLHRCISIAKEYHIYLIGVINVVDSLIAREVNCGCYINAGREVAVASTKSFTSQVIILSLIAIWYAQERKINIDERKNIIKDLLKLNFDINRVIKKSDLELNKYLNIFDNKKSCFILGKSIGEYIAKEGALKIKEISYIHAEGYSSGSLKHGPFALLEKDFPIILLAPNNYYYYKSLNAYEEIKSRGGNILFITNDTNCKDKKSLILPINKSYEDLLNIIPLQLLGYKLALKKNINPDIPKNLAKVVTVE